MKKWGNKFIDNRDWKAYNEELVVRGEFLLELDWINSWDDELDKMNQGKRGAQYCFPDSLIRLQAVWYQWIDYRGLEGIARKLNEYDLIPSFNDFSTINRRVRKLELGFKLPDRGTVNVSCDGSGMKLTNRGEYRINKYGDKRRKYAKVTISADPITKELLACDVIIEGDGPSEPETAQIHMESMIENEARIEKFWGDGSFDTRKLFNFCQKNGIETAIKIRRNATRRSLGSMRRAREVRGYQKDGYNEWAKKRKYGHRWPGTEGIFSAVKRKSGENTRSRSILGIFHEVKIKFWAYQNMKEYAKSRA